MSRKITFSAPSGGSTRWRAFVGQRSVELCNSDIHAYIDLPLGCESFDAIFTVTKPANHDSFQLVTDPDKDADHPEPDRIGLNVTSRPGYYANARDFMKKQYADGYRYIRVEF